jgi:hypothetical protein
VWGSRMCYVGVDDDTYDTAEFDSPNYTVSHPTRFESALRVIESLRAALFQVHHNLTYRD